MSSQNKIAIVGAGISGLSCATVLDKAGFQVTLFEKSRGVSGRLSTRMTAHWQCDHGAQYFTARDPLFHAEVQRWIDADVARLWQPSLKVFDGKNFSAKEANDGHLTERYVGYPSNSSPARWLATQLNLMTQTTIDRIEKHGNQWQLHSKEHGLHAECFDFLVLSIPAPQATALLNNTQSTLTSLCAQVKATPCLALMVQFNASINCNFDGLFINSGLLSWISRDSSKPGRTANQDMGIETWLLHAHSQWSKSHIDDESELIANYMLEEFRRILNLDAAAHDAEPVLTNQLGHTLHRWLYADFEHYFTNHYLFDTEQNIGLCGDWLNGGKVQGAWLSGLHLAKQLIDSYAFSRTRT
jgi:renalase